MFTLGRCFKKNKNACSSADFQEFGDNIMGTLSVSLISLDSTGHICQMNTIKFTETGGIRMGYRNNAANQTVETFVHDTGKDIPAKSLQHISEHFYKVDTFIKGVGLGLSISRTITENMGGRIEVISTEGKGSCFRVCLPSEP